MNSNLDETQTGLFSYLLKIEFAGILYRYQSIGNFIVKILRMKDYLRNFIEALLFSSQNSSLPKKFEQIERVDRIVHNVPFILSCFIHVYTP